MGAHCHRSRPTTTRLSFYDVQLHIVGAREREATFGLSVIPGRIEDANYDVLLHIGESIVPHECWEKWIPGLVLRTIPE
jgi:hypothetical protein